MSEVLSTIGGHFKGKKYKVKNDQFMLTDQSFK